VNAFSTRLVLAWLVSVGAACTSAPIRYYTLTPPSDKTPAFSQTPPAIDVRVVHIPPQVNRSELMIRTGPVEVMLLENERWASPVNDEFKNALGLEVLRRLGRRTGLRPVFTTLTLVIDVQHLEAELGRHALLQASWSARLSGPGRPHGSAWAATCAFRADEEIHNGYAEMVEGYQRDIAALADAIVAVLPTSASDIGAPCPTSMAGSAGGSGPTDQKGQ